MREIIRLVTFFLFATLLIGFAYGTGFYSAYRLSNAGLIHNPLARLGFSNTNDGSGAGVVAGADQESGVAATESGSTGGAPTTRRSAAGAPGALVPQEDAGFKVYWDAWHAVKEHALNPPPDEKAITYGSIRGSLESLDDPFTLFSDPVDAEIQNADLNGQFEGIGAYVNTNGDGLLEIQTPMRGQPAEKAGVHAGDVVIKVDETDITKLNINEAVKLIRGPKGTTVQLTILRKGVSGTLVIAVTRDKIDIPSVNDVRLLDKEGAPEVGYLQLTVFAAETNGELVKALDELRAKGAKALVLDLRNDPGGYLNTAIDVASQFIGDGIVVIQDDGKGHREEIRAEPGGHALDLPLVVLINKGSASASEIVSGAVRDHKRGVLVGQTSFGKGSVQNVHSLSDESQLRVTIAAWLTPNGTLIHKKGITPDVVVEPNPVGAALSDAGNASDTATGSTGDTATGTAGDTTAVPVRRDIQLERAVTEAKRLLATK